MDTDSFWTLLEDSRQHGFDGSRGGSAGGDGCGDGDGRVARLREQLARHPPAGIVGFQARLDQLTDAARTWDLWAAADRIFGGWCSDDAFRAFQHWVMGLGRAVFKVAVGDPDSLAYAPEVLRLSGRPRALWSPADRPAWPALDTVGLAAYELATGPSDDFGDSFYAAVRAAQRTTDVCPAAWQHTAAGPADHDPQGDRWSARDEAEASRRLPRLSVMFPLDAPGEERGRPAGPAAV